jgi:hypothetical protein
MIQHKFKLYFYLKEPSLVTTVAKVRVKLIVNFLVIDGTAS